MNQFPRPLSDFLNRSDGIDTEQALDRAALHLESMRGKIERGLDDNVAAIGAMFDGDAGDLRAQAQTLYTLADGILSVAAMFQRKTLGDIAFSLCDLLQVFERARIWDNSAIRAHYEAMRLVQAKPLALRNGVAA